jgi:hypothetical protein
VLAFGRTSGTHVTALSIFHNPEATMPAITPWNLDPTRLLTRRELATVLADLATRAPRSANDRRNRIVFRLGAAAACVFPKSPDCNSMMSLSTSSGRTFGCAARSQKAIVRGLYHFGGTPARSQTSPLGTWNAVHEVPEATTRSSVPYNRTVTEWRYNERRYGAGFYLHARRWDCPGSGR